MQLAGTVQGKIAAFYKGEKSGMLRLEYSDQIKNLVNFQNGLAYHYDGLAGKDLSYLPVLNQIEDKVIYTFTSLYEALSTIPDGTIFTTYLHKATAGGFHGKSALSQVLKSWIKFYPELQTSRFEYELDKNSPEFKQFIGAITYSMVIFGSNAFIKEGRDGTSAGFSLLASLTELLSDIDVRTSSASNPLSTSFSSIGQAIYDSTSTAWNIDPTGEQVWNPEDTMPAYMVMQTQEERDYVLQWFNNLFGLRGEYTIENFLRI